MSEIKVHLHPILSEEDLLIQRVNSLPKDRRQEYLRGLLLKGFRQEQAEAVPHNTLRDDDQVDARAERGSAVKHEFKAEHAGRPNSAPLLANGDTLSSLKNVIG